MTDVSPSEIPKRDHPPSPHWYRTVFGLAFPLILSNLTQPLLSIVDTMVSGHLPSPAALGGVAMGGIFFNMVFWAFGFLRMGTTGLIAQASGAGNGKELRAHFDRALLLAAIFGCAILLLQYPLIHLAISLLGGSPPVRQNALLYCSIRIWSAPAALGNYVLLGYLLGRQRARLALLLQVIINCINMIAALFFVFHLGWGIAGVGGATALADWTGLLAGLFLVKRAYPETFSPMPGLRLFDREQLMRLCAINGDIFLRTISLVAAFAWFTRTGALEGDAILAANAVLLNLQTFAAYGLDGFANATEALVGAAVGARRESDFRASIRASTVWAFLVSFLISAIYFFFGRDIISILTNQTETRALAFRYLPWEAVLPVISVWGFQLDGIFIGATRTRALRNSMLLSSGGFLLLAVLLLRYFGNDGLWCAFCLFMALRGLTLTLYLPGIAQSLRTIEPQPAR